MSALLGFLVFFLFVYFFFCQLTYRRPLPLFSYDTLRVFATSSLVAHSFLVKVICFAVSILWKIRSVGERPVYRHLADLIVAGLDQGTLQDACLKANKNEEIPVVIGSRLFA